MVATGNAGQLAIQIAKHSGAARVVAAGRDQRILETLPALGADAIVSLSGAPSEIAERLGAAAGDVDVVLDYLWGKPAEDAMMPLLKARSDRSQALDWVQIGSVAGPTLALPSAALRSANLRVMGSGQGSVTAAGILAELPELAGEIVKGTFTVDPLVVPLTDVERAWTAPTAHGQRVVIVPARK